MDVAVAGILAADTDAVEVAELHHQHQHDYCSHHHSEDPENLSMVVDELVDGAPYRMVVVSLAVNDNSVVVYDDAKRVVVVPVLAAPVAGPCVVDLHKIAGRHHFHLPHC